jgi:Tol biopolymer transport system component
MTARRDADHLIAMWLTETSPEGYVDYLDETLEGIDAIRQRPAWAIPGRWVPMQTTLQRVALPRLAPLLVILVLLIVAAIAVLAIAGSRQQRLPAPFGVAATGLVAFESDGHIVAAAADGSGRRTLIGGAGAQWSPVWSRRGDRIAYWSAPSSGAAASLWIAGSDGSNPHLVTGAHTYLETQGLPELSWSPDDRRLAFASDTGDLFVVNADGTGLQPLGDGSHARFDPVWSPDGTLIAYRGQPVNDPNSTTSSWVIGADGSNDTKVISAEGGWEVANVNPSWSLDGRSFLVHTGGRSEGADVDISIAQRDAAGNWSDKAIIGGPTADFMPSWSNSGTQFSFIRVVDGSNPEQYVPMAANADGSNVHRVGSREVGFAPLCWSPDDRFIRAAGKDTGAGRTILLIPLDGTNAVEIPAPGDASTGVCQMQRLAP